jgi:hypothetical protein
VDLQKPRNCKYQVITIHLKSDWHHVEEGRIVLLVDVMHGIKKEACLASSIKANAIH